MNLPQITQTVSGKAETKCCLPNSKSGKVSSPVTSNISNFTGNKIQSTLLPSRLRPSPLAPEAGHCLLPTFCLHHYPWMQILQPHVDTSVTYCGQIPQLAVWPLGMTQNWKIRLTNKALSGGIWNPGVSEYLWIFLHSQRTNSFTLTTFLKKAGLYSPFANVKTEVGEQVDLF